MEAMSRSVGGPACWGTQAKPKIVAAMLRTPKLLPIMVPPFVSCAATQGPHGLGRAGLRKYEPLHQFHQAQIRKSGLRVETEAGVRHLTQRSASKHSVQW